MIVDSHCHAWPIWPYAEVPDAATRGSVESLLFEMDDAGVDTAILVAARIGSGALANLDNNQYVASAAAARPDRLIAAVDVDSRWSSNYHRPGAVERLVAELDATNARAVSHYTADETIDGWFSSSAAAEFFVELERRRAVLSIHAYPAWQRSLREIAVKVPSLPILVHHLGHPHTADELDQVVASARHTNIHVKVSGPYYVAESTWDFPYQREQELVARLRDAYGPERLLWGSDFPVSRSRITYRQSLEFVRSKCSFLDERERRLVLGENAARMFARSGLRS